MRVDLPNARLLPLTIAVTAAVLLIKAVTLGQIALASDLPPAATDDTPASTSTPNPAVPHPTPLPAAPPPAALPVGAPRIAGEDRPEPAAPDLSLLGDLRAEKARLDLRAARLDAREAAADIAERRLTATLAEVKRAEARLHELEDARQTRDETAWAGLVKVYEAMRPADAANIFNALEVHTLLALLDRMNERKAALVLASMQPERARLATQMLAQMRLRNEGALAAASSAHPPT